MKNIKKLIALTLIGAGIIAASPTSAHAEWKVDNTGWWYTEGNSWATGWREIGGAWYYFYSDGYMAHDTTIDGYYLNSFGEYEPGKSIGNSNAIPSGTYKVGVDIQAGEYLLLSGDYYGYFECTSDLSGSVESIIYNHVLSENEPAYLTVNSGEYLKVDNSVMYKIADAPSIKPANNVYCTGQYKVGRDIPAGTYKVIDLGNGIVQVNTKSRHNADDAVVFETLNGKDLYITVEDGQYIELLNAQINA